MRLSRSLRNRCNLTYIHGYHTFSLNRRDNMEPGEVVALIASVLAIVGSNFALFLWARSESRNDIRHLETKLESKIDNLINAIQTETKDFHGRLCGLEGKSK